MRFLSLGRTPLLVSGAAACARPDDGEDERPPTPPPPRHDLHRRCRSVFDADGPHRVCRGPGDEDT